MSGAKRGQDRPQETAAEEPSKMPGQTPPLEHSAPRRHRRALRSALTVAGLGVIVFLTGAIFLILDARIGILVSLMVVGVTMLILSPVWYFSYMEKLEPELYSPDTPEEPPRDQDQERRQ